MEFKAKNNHLRKWYNNYQFSLVPLFRKTKADDYNTSNYSFDWMFIKIWTLDSFEFEVSFVANTHWGIGFIGMLPYLRWVICIPCPHKIVFWCQTNLWRTAKIYRKILAKDYTP